MTQFAKKSANFRKGEVSTALDKLIRGKRSHVVNTAESERPLGFACVDCLVNKCKLLNDDLTFGCYSMTLGDLNTYMKVIINALILHTPPYYRTPSVLLLTPTPTPTPTTAP